MALDYEPKFATMIGGGLITWSLKTCNILGGLLAPLRHAGNIRLSTGQHYVDYDGGRRKLSLTDHGMLATLITQGFGLQNETYNEIEAF